MRSILLLFVVICTTSSFAQPTIQWQKAYGGAMGTEDFDDIRQTADGGYIAIGHSNAKDGDVSGYQGGTLDDIWVVKLTNTGAISWERCYGGTKNELGWCIQQTTDGGYIFCAETWSSDGDVAGSNGSGDAWVVKLTATGAISWQKCLGSTVRDRFRSVRQTPDGGYILAGASDSSNADVSQMKGKGEAWVVKLDATGNVTWQKYYGGTESEHATFIDLCADGNYILTGNTLSNNGDVTQNKGGQDAWIVKLDDTGRIIWQRTFGGTGGDYVNMLTELPAGGFVFVGFTSSADGDVKNPKGGSDIWVVRLDNNGALRWSGNYGGSMDENGTGVVINHNGEYVITGTTESKDKDISWLKSLNDKWLFALKPDGSIIWERTIGGSADDGANALILTSDSSYVTAGFTKSNNLDAANNGYHVSNYSDAWVAKLGFPSGVSDLYLHKNKITVYPTVTNGDINIKLQATGEAATVQMTDLFGRAVPSTQTQQGDIITLTPGNIAPATYLLKVTVGKDVYTARIVYQP